MRKSYLVIAAVEQAEIDSLVIFRKLTVDSGFIQLETLDAMAVDITEAEVIKRLLARATGE